MSSAIQSVRPELVEGSGQDTRAALRFVTCGSVDDGKSTLIGRLLVDIAMTASLRTERL